MRAIRPLGTKAHLSVGSELREEPPLQANNNPVPPPPHNCFFPCQTSRVLSKKQLFGGGGAGQKQRNNAAFEAVQKDAAPFVNQNVHSRASKTGTSPLQAFGLRGIASRVASTLQGWGGKTARGLPPKCTREPTKEANVRARASSFVYSPTRQKSRLALLILTKVLVPGFHNKFEGGGLGGAVQGWGRIGRCGSGVVKTLLDWSGPLILAMLCGIVHLEMQACKIAKSLLTDCWPTCANVATSSHQQQSPPKS